MIGDYHSVTCWSDECDGWMCGCWCHDDETPVGEEDSGYRMVELETQKKTAPAGNRGLTATTDWES